MAAPFYVYDLLASETLARWGADAPRGTPITITYSFPTAQPSSTSYPNFTPFTATEITATRNALAYIGTLTKISFVETSAASGELQFGNGDLSAFGSGVSGRASYSYTDAGIQNATVFLSNTGGASLAGSDFVPGSITSNDIGGHGWGTLLHEIGHALGFKHPFEQNNAGDPNSVLASNLDNLSHTVMSYTPYQPSNVAIVTGNASSYSYQSSNLAPQTYSLYDIAALQYLYGTPAASAGNKVFAFSPNAPVFTTLYDTGPNNTIDCSALTGPSTINLNAGTTSNLAIHQDLPFGLTIDNQYNGSSAVTLAYGCVIANAIGGSGVDQILGNGLANRLDGRGGADTMRGGLGGDIYTFDNTGDRAIEAANQGTDSVLSSAGCTLGANVENLTLTGSGAINGTGNDLANTINGNNAANALNGGGGADRLTGGLGNDTYVTDGLDTLVESSASGGTDRVLSSATLTLGTNLENLTLTGTANINGTGNGLANAIVGNAGNNLLDGKALADTMAGAAGNDTYMVDSSSDRAIEAVDAGTDTVISSASFTLGVNVERLTLTGTGALSGAGNALANILTGNGGANPLTGNGGRDTSIGGAGADTFVFKALSDSGVSSSTRDLITDFSQAQHDRIDLHFIDANTVLSGDQGFSFIGTAAFHRKAGELQAVISGSETLVQADVNGDGRADFAVQLHGQLALQKGDFVL